MTLDLNRSGLEDLKEMKKELNSVANKAQNALDDLIENYSNYSKDEFIEKYYKLFLRATNDIGAIFNKENVIAKRTNELEN